ncbi:MAG: ThuA domain-containing protein [Flavitalea sp.]
MKLFLSTIIILLCITASASPKKYKVLIFCKTAGYHHHSITDGLKAIQQLGTENGFSVDTTTDSTAFTIKNLKQYSAVIFLNTTGNVLSEVEQQAFEQYIKGGGGFVGVHAATDTEYDWPWYGNLVGAYFYAHPSEQVALLHVSDRTSIATKHLPAEWKREDEWYNYKWMTTEPIHVLIAIDETSYDAGPGKMGDTHPMSWYHDFDGGRAFYTELGHTEESYSDPLYLKHLLGGISYAMGAQKMEP